MIQKSRIEILREQKDKIDEQLKKALAQESAKNRKLETRDKILLGVMLQGMVADGVISAELFERAILKYLKNDKDRNRCNSYFALHRSQNNKV
jgi:hypothetical protein